MSAGLAFFPILAFWILDGYFLRQERLFRRLYDEVRRPPTKVDFSMDTRPFKHDVPGWFGTCCSITLGLFHGTVGALAVVIVAVIECG